VINQNKARLVLIFLHQYAIEIRTHLPENHKLRPAHKKSQRTIKGAEAAKFNHHSIGTPNKYVRSRVALMICGR
jgi:hypothetical protein